MTSQNFRQFITSLLERGDISKKKCNLFTKNIQLFELAFTHKSVDEIENNELLEWSGDPVVNFAVTEYLREWDSNIVSVKYLTRLKHNIMSKKSLALIAEKANFWQWIIMDPELRQKFDEMTEDYKHKNKDYMSILEDSFEAFIGALKQSVDEISKGLGYPVCYRVIKSFLKEIEISLDYKDVFDAKTRYKELCDRRGWDFGTAMKTKEVFIEEKKRYKVIVIGYPFGDKKKDINNKEELGSSTCPIKVDAQNEAAEMALTILRENYDIYDCPPDPYKRKN